LCLIRCLLVVRFPWDSRTPRDHVLRVGVDHEDIFLRMGCLFAALGRLWLRVICRALAAAFCAVHLELRAAGERQRPHRDSTRLALWGFSQVAQGVLQDREEAIAARHALAVDSSRMASRASFAADGSCGRPRGRKVYLPSRARPLWRRRRTAADAVCLLAPDQAETFSRRLLETRAATAQTRLV